MQLEVTVEGKTAAELQFKAQHAAKALSGEGMQVESVSVTARGSYYELGEELPTKLEAVVSISYRPEHVQWGPMPDE